METGKERGRAVLYAKLMRGHVACVNFVSCLVVVLPWPSALQQLCLVNII